jgi:hypothetical protein
MTMIEWQAVEDIERRTGAELAARFTPRKGWQIVCDARLTDADRMAVAAHRQGIVRLLGLRQLARQYKFDAPDAVAGMQIDASELRDHMCGLRKGEDRKAFEAGWPGDEGGKKTEKGR